MRCSLGLVHYPVYSPRGDVIATSITNMDLHDLARAARTYGAQHFYVIQPMEDQRAVAHNVARYWTAGRGGARNPARQEAMRLIVPVESLDAALADLREREGTEPALVGTSAQASPRPPTAYATLRQLLSAGDRHYLLLIGTGWGLAQEVLERCDHCLPPLMGAGNYNHLSARSAGAIVLDRLLGDRGD